MKQYDVTGMSCAACSARVEKAVSKVPGVDSCTVSLLTNSMSVDGSASADDVIAAVQKAGYGASPKADGAAKGAKNTDSADAAALKERTQMKNRIISSVVFLIILMYFSMGHMMWGWPLPSFFDGNHIAMGLVQLILSGIIMVINQKFFISGFKGLVHRAPNMDTLVALGSAAAFVYSTYALFAMTGASLRGDDAAVMTYMHDFYFESAAMILTLITVGKALEARSKGKTTDALKGLMKLSPKTATVLKDGKETEVPIETVVTGDIFTVRPGESVPVDGVVLEGTSAVDESALTGESIPVDKKEGATVSAATINQSGFLRCRATRVGENTTLSQIIKMVSDAAATKAPIAKVADRVSAVFVPSVIGIAVLTLIVWLIVGKAPGFALARAISVLVISCPCALGLATPVAIMVGNGVGAKHGILFKTAVSLEETGKTKIAVLDKTGTVTEGRPKVTDILPVLDNGETELTAAALSLEQNSEHPLGKAILEYAADKGLSPLPVTDFEALPGNGLKAVLGGENLLGGNLKFIEKSVTVPHASKQTADELSNEGKTPLFFAKGKEFLGIIAVADVIKPDSAAAVKELKDMGIRVVMLTGDNERTAKAIGKQAGVDEVIAGVLPDGKESVVRSLQKNGSVAMVGDGINDAPALTAAETGIAVGAGTDIAMDAADVVLMNSRLSDVPAAIKLSRATLKNIHENLFWAFFYNALGIPLAAGVFISLLGWQLNPMFAAAAMSLSSFSVVSNALRLNFWSPDKKVRRIKSADTANDNNKNFEKAEKESKTMTKTIRIEGMMCGHCEAHVKAALEKLDGVESVAVSFKDGTAVVTLSAETEDNTLKSAVENEGYKVISIE